MSHPWKCPGQGLEQKKIPAHGNERNFKVRSNPFKFHDSVINCNCRAHRKHRAVNPKLDVNPWQLPDRNRVLHIPRAVPTSRKASASSKPQEKQLWEQGGLSSLLPPSQAQNSLLAPHSLAPGKHELILNSPLEMSFSPFNSWERTKAGRWAALCLKRIKNKCQEVNGISGVQ